MSQPSESCKLMLSASQPTNTEVSSGSLSIDQDNKTTQVEVISECKASDLELCSVESDTIKPRLDAGDHALSENSDKEKKEDLLTAGKPAIKLDSAHVAGEGSFGPTGNQETKCVSGGQAAADQSSLSGILPCAQGGEAQSEDSPLEETSEPEAVPETQCEEEEKQQVKEKQMSEDGSLDNMALSQRFSFEKEVQCHEDMEVDFVDGSCKNSKNLSDQAQGLEEIGPESQGKEPSEDTSTFGTKEAKSMDKLPFKADLENMPKLNKVLSKLSGGELLEQHNNLCPKLKSDTLSEAVLCAKKQPDCSELGQTMIKGNQPPPQEREADMLVAQQKNQVPKSMEDTVVTRNLEHEEQMQPQERATAKSPSPSSGK